MCGLWFFFLFWFGFGGGGCYIFCFIFKWKPTLWNTISWSKKCKFHIFCNAETQHGMKKKTHNTKRKHTWSDNGVHGKKRCYCVCLRILPNAAEWSVFSHFYKIIASVKKTHQPLCVLESRQAVLQEKSLLGLKTSPTLLLAGISATDCPFWRATERQLLTEENSVKSESKDDIFEKS